MGAIHRNTLTSADFQRITRYGQRSVDGYDEDLLCVNGKFHIAILEDPYEEEPAIVSYEGVCDGSCREKRTDLRELIDGLTEQFQLENGRIVEDPLHIDGLTRAALNSDEPLLGRTFDDSYCKRNSESVHVCTGERHVQVTTEFSWWSGRNPDVGQTHRVTSTPCDGSCSQTIRLPQAILKRAWRRIAKELGL